MTLVNPILQIQGWDYQDWNTELFNATNHICRAPDAEFPSLWTVSGPFSEGVLVVPEDAPILLYFLQFFLAQLGIDAVIFLNVVFIIFILI